MAYLKFYEFIEYPLCMQYKRVSVFENPPCYDINIKYMFKFATIKIHSYILIATIKLMKQTYHAISSGAVMISERKNKNNFGRMHQNDKSALTTE